MLMFAVSVMVLAFQKDNVTVREINLIVKVSVVVTLLMINAVFAVVMVSLMDTVTVILTELTVMVSVVVNMV